MEALDCSQSSHGNGYKAHQTKCASLPTITHQDNTDEWEPCECSDVTHSTKTVPWQRNLKSLTKQLVWVGDFAIHFLPVAITIGLVVLYAKGVVWNPDSNEINGILVAAKIYEYLLMGSLSSILLHRIRSGLRSSRGVPLGFLTTPFQVSSPFSFIASRLFWGGGPRRGLNLKNDLTTNIFTSAIIFLALAIGPSSGIIMVPKLDWWPAPVSMQPLENGYSGAILLKAHFDEIYPTALNFSVNRPSCMQESQADVYVTSDTLECSSGGLSQILHTLPQVLSLSYIDKYVSNITISDRDYSKSISVGWQFTDDKTNAVAYATTPLDVVTRQSTTQGFHSWQQFHTPLKAMFQAVTYSQKSEIDPSDRLRILTVATIQQWRHPAVEVNCVTLQKDDKWYTASIAVGSRAVSRFRLERTLVDQHFGSQPFEGLSYIDIGGSLPFRSSAALISKSTNTTSLCIIAAQWIKSEAWILKPFSSGAQTNIAVDPSASLSKEFEDMSNIIAISEEWTSLMNGTVKFVDSNSGSNLEKSVPGLVGLAMACEGHTSTRCLSHGYGLHGITQSMAWVMVMIHLVLVIVHVSEHVLRKKTYSHKAWSDLEELMSLAIKPHAAQLLQFNGLKSNKAEMRQLRVFMRDDPNTVEAVIIVEHPGATLPSDDLRKRPQK
ncbi:hypothetical protein JX266_005617 [Neoarthrinium moseri]|nr:hypothetical protein JX266_005617 [Neoarthrinium moseri]